MRPRIWLSGARPCPESRGRYLARRRTPRELGERHERFTHAVAGVIVAVGAALAGLRALAVSEAAQGRSVPAPLGSAGRRGGPAVRPVARRGRAGAPAGRVCRGRRRFCRRRTRCWSCFPVPSTAVSMKRWRTAPTRRRRPCKVGASCGPQCAYAGQRGRAGADDWTMRWRRTLRIPPTGLPADLITGVPAEGPKHERRTSFAEAQRELQTRYGQITKHLP